jgi:hypothetical protein
MDVIKRINSVLKKKNQEAQTTAELNRNDKDRLITETHKYFEQITEDFDFSFQSDEMGLFKNEYNTNYTVMIYRNNKYYERDLVFRKKYDKKNKERLSPITIRRNSIAPGNIPTLWSPLDMYIWPLNELREFYDKREEILERIWQKISQK